MRVRIFNLVMIVGLLTFILFVTAFFFMGSIDTFDEQRAELPKYFLGRILFGIAIGVPGCIVIAVINLFIDRRGRIERRKRIFRIVLVTLLLSTLVSVIGTGIFFLS